MRLIDVEEARDTEVIEEGTETSAVPVGREAPLSLCVSRILTGKPDFFIGVRECFACLRGVNFREDFC